MCVGAAAAHGPLAKSGFVHRRVGRADVEEEEKKTVSSTSTSTNTSTTLGSREPQK